LTRKRRLGITLIILAAMVLLLALHVDYVTDITLDILVLGFSAYAVASWTYRSIKGGKPVPFERYSKSFLRFALDEDEEKAEKANDVPQSKKYKNNA
jgi:hypothetical protein